MRITCQNGARLKTTSKMEEGLFENVMRTLLAGACGCVADATDKRTVHLVAC